MYWPYFLTNLIYPFFVFQSLLDFTSSLVLLLSSVTITDFYKVRRTGILGWMECHLWNSELLSFGLFVSSTWNIVVLTIERFVSFMDFNKFHNPSKKVSYLFLLDLLVSSSGVEISTSQKQVEKLH